jgi:hypothetical protein
MLANSKTNIMIIERGARWSWSILDHDGEDCLLIAQQDDESPKAFADRVTRRLLKSVSEGRSVRRAVLALGPTGRDASESRRSIWRTLASAWPAAEVDVFDEDAPDSRAA